MSGRTVVVIVGFGLAIVGLFLPYTVESMPSEVSIPLVGIGVLMIVVPIVLWVFGRRKPRELPASSAEERFRKAVTPAVEPNALRELMQDALSPSPSSRALREQLQDFYNEGERIRKGLPQPPAAAALVGAVSRARSGQRDKTREDVVKWEAAVTALLRDRAEWRYWFTSDPPVTQKGMAAFYSISQAMNETPLRRLMTHRLGQLARIIEQAG